MPVNPNKIFNIVIDKKLEQKVREVAEKEQRTISAQMRVMLEDWFEENEK